MILAKIDEVRAIMASVEDGQDTFPESKVPPQAPASPPDENPAAPPVKKDVYHAVKRCTDVGIPTDKLVLLFAQYGADGLNSLSLEHYAAVIRDCKALLDAWQAGQTHFATDAQEALG